MSNSEDQDRTPFLEKSHTPQLRLPILSRSWITIVTIAVQVAFCSFTWVFAGVMIAKKSIPLSGNLAAWVYKNQSETNFLVTMTSTALGMTGSFLLGINMQHALTFRLSRGVRLLTATTWIQLARSALFFQPRRHVWWTFLSVLWVAVIHSLTTAWSNLLTPEIFVQKFTSTGQEIDLLKPAVSELLLVNISLPFITPTSRNYSLTPISFGFLANITGYLTEAGSSATTAFLDPSYPSFVGNFNSSTGGVNPETLQHQFHNFPNISWGYQEVPTPYTFVQQGFTANISCRALSSPIIALNNSASTQFTFETPAGPFDYTLETWSWSTNCSGNGDYNTGQVTLLSNNETNIGNGLFAISVCFYQDFSGPSNQSFLILMQSPNDSGYSQTYFAADPNLTTVCEFTPMVTTVEVQYNSSGLTNVNRVLGQTPLPDYAYPLQSIQGFTIWALYLLAQGLYSNSFADAPLELAQLVNPQFGDDLSSLLAQYLRGIFEYMGSVIRGSIESSLPSLPSNMTTQISGTMSVQTVGWRFHPRTHSIALAVITLVTAVTAASGIFVISEASSQKMARDALERGSAAAFNPTRLMDVLAASSKGSLANKLSECEAEECEKLTAGLAVTDRGLPVLNVLDADVADDAITLRGDA